MRWATALASVRVLTESLRRMRATSVATVLEKTKSSPAISALDRPQARTRSSAQIVAKAYASASRLRARFVAIGKRCRLVTTRGRPVW